MGSEHLSLLEGGDSRDAQRERSWWYKAGRVLVRWPWNVAIVVVVVAAVVPFALNAFDFGTRCVSVSVFHAHTHRVAWCDCVIVVLRAVTTCCWTCHVTRRPRWSLKT